MSKLNALRESQSELTAKARAKLEEIKDDTPEARAKEIEAEYDAIMADYDKIEANVKIEEAREEKRARLAEIEERASRPDPRRPTGDVVSPRADADAEGAAEKRADAWRNYLRYGAADLPQEMRALLVQSPERENRAMGVLTGTAGGYLVPDQFMPDLIKSMAAWGPMLDGGIVRQMRTATGASIPWPTMDDTSNTGRRIAENTTVTTTEVSFGIKTLGAYKYTSDVVLVASELLQDSALNVEEIVNAAMSERIGRIGNTELTQGTAASMPNGMMVAAGAGATAASATAITFDDLINLEHSIDPAYRGDPSCRWMFHDTTLKAIRKLKDGDGNYIWQPANVQTGAPTTLLGYPYSINQAVDTIATGVKSVAFGAFNRYVVRIVNQFSIRRLVERYADSDQVAFIGFARFDGNLIDAAAIKRLIHP